MAALIAVAALPQSALFTVQRIEVTGAATLSAAEVIALSGLRSAERLFAVDAEAAHRRLSADPRIRAAAVRVRPPRTVTIAVTERRPVAALVVDGGFARMADDLVIVAVTPDAGGLPEVVDRAGEIRRIRPGHVVTAEGVRAALAALAVIPPPLAQELARIVVAAGPDLTFVTRAGLEIKAGGLAGLSDRLRQVSPVLDALRARGVRPAALDLRYGGSVVVTPVGATGAGDGR